MAQAQSDKETAEQKLDEALNSNDSQVNQYAILVKMLQAYRNNDLTGAVTLYPGFNPSIFTDEEVLAIANGIKQDIETNGYQTLEDLAYTMWSAGRMDDALNYYNTCLTIRPDNPNVLFNMGMIYRSKQDFAKAVELFTQVSTQYGDSEYAEKARNQLTELAPYVQSAAGQSDGGRGDSRCRESGKVRQRLNKRLNSLDCLLGEGQIPTDNRKLRHCKRNCSFVLLTVSLFYITGTFVPCYIASSARSHCGGKEMSLSRPPQAENPCEAGFS